MVTLHINISERDVRASFHGFTLEPVGCARNIAMRSDNILQDARANRAAPRLSSSSSSILTPLNAQLNSERVAAIRTPVRIVLIIAGFTANGS